MKSVNINCQSGKVRGRNLSNQEEAQRQTESALAAEEEKQQKIVRVRALLVQAISEENITGELVTEGLATIADHQWVTDKIDKLRTELRELMR